MKYPVVFEPTPSGFSAYVIDMDGCVSTGATLEEVRKNIRDAIEFHIEGMRKDNDQIPQPSIVEFIDIFASV